MAISRALRWFVLLVLLTAIAAAAGCSTVGYYFQAVNGQMELARKARPIPKVIADPATEPELKAKLDRVQEMRNFASRELGLPDNASYRRYADLGRPYVVWNVFAAPEFSVMPREWCFPFAGCVGYKGYFKKAGADEFAGALRSEHYDVFVGGVPAYSTLGWLDDPVLNTFVRYPDPEIARLIFHELAHQVVYVKGDSTFNESFAVTVEQEGVRRWVAAHGTEEQQRQFDQARARQRVFVELVEKYRARLVDLYAQPLEQGEMRARKEQVLGEMRSEYARLKQAWGGYAGYDGWFEQPLNNAHLASVAIYTQLVPGFEQLLRDSGGDLPRFYAQVRELAKLPEPERGARLAGGASATHAISDTK
jgi:predicted aminopeptidase